MANGIAFQDQMNMIVQLYNYYFSLLWQMTKVISLSITYNSEVHMAWGLIAAAVSITLRLPWSWRPVLASPPWRPSAPRLSASVLYDATNAARPHGNPQTPATSGALSGARISHRRHPLSGTDVSTEAQTGHASGLPDQEETYSELSGCSSRLCRGDSSPIPGAPPVYPECFPVYSGLRIGLLTWYY